MFDNFGFLWKLDTQRIFWNFTFKFKNFISLFLIKFFNHFFLIMRDDNQLTINMARVFMCIYVYSRSRAFVKKIGNSKKQYIVIN